MPAQLPRLNLITPKRKVVLNRQLVNNQLVKKQPVNRQPVNPIAVFRGGMVNRIANTPAGCGCGGAR